MLYLVRHAHAEDAASDAERPLSRRGRAQAERLAEFLEAGSLPAPQEVWHSPLLRARETAEIVAESLHWKAPLRPVDGLLPDDAPGGIAKRIPAGRHIAVFGHNPHLTLLGTLLVTGRLLPAAFSFKKSSALGLEPGGEAKPGGWLVLWHIDPDFLD